VKKVFEREADVRRWWKEQARSAGEAEALFWVEAGAGGTFGMPDLFYAWNGVLWPFELKLGKVRNGVLSVSVRPQQKAVWRRMSRAGIITSICVGLAGARTIIVCDVKAIITGKATDYEEVFGFWEIKHHLSSRFQVPFFYSFEDSPGEKGNSSR
jgi:hypothetical protein